MTKTTKGASGSAEARGLSKVEAATAAEILERYEPSEEASSLLVEGMSPIDYFDALRAKQLAEDAIAFLAYALPRREGLLWGLRCVTSITPEEPAEAIAAALAAAQAWIDEPSEEKRYEAFAAAEAATYDTPAGCLALAVFFSEGSLAPADCPAVPVGEWFCARTLAIAVHVGCLTLPQDQAPKTAAEFLDLGFGIANEPAPWDSAAS